MSFSHYYKVLNLYDAAEVAYGDGRHEQSAELYRQALEIAEAHDDVPAWLRGVLRRAYADELVALERLREALAVLAPMSRKDDAGPDYRSCCVFGNMTDQIEIAQMLPVSLKAIEGAYALAEGYYPSAGERSWASRILHYKSELLLLRGRLREALSTAQEAWAIWHKDCPRLYGTTHLESLFRVALALRDAEAADRHLRRWVAQSAREEKKYKIRDAVYWRMESELARLRGDGRGALEHARRAQQCVEMIDWGVIRYEVSCSVVRAFLLAGEHRRARDVLARLAQMRRSESGHHRYAFQLLRADFHLACARRAAGMIAADDELGTNFAAPGALSNPRAPVYELRKARAAYDAALEIGRWLDAQLECDARRKEIRTRLARVEEIERAAEPDLRAVAV